MMVLNAPFNENCRGKAATHVSKLCKRVPESALPRPKIVREAGSYP